jgi:hypothetical protein
MDGEVLLAPSLGPELAAPAWAPPGELEVPVELAVLVEPASLAEESEESSGADVVSLVVAVEAGEDEGEVGVAVGVGGLDVACGVVVVAAFYLGEALVVGARLTPEVGLGAGLDVGGGGGGGGGGGVEVVVVNRYVCTTASPPHMTMLGAFCDPRFSRTVEQNEFPAPELSMLSAPAQGGCC